MKETDIEFFSDGITLRGSLYLPENHDPSRSYPSVVACSGYTGLNAIYPRLFGEALTPKGFVVLGFDYRGCGESDGERGRLLLEEQVKDIRNGVTFLKYHTRATGGRLGLLGWGMGAALVIQAAYRNPDVAAVAGVNGFYDGRSFLEASFSEEGYRELLSKMEADRRTRVFDGTVRLSDPFEAYPLDPDTRDVVDERLRPVKHYEIRTSFELAESIYRFDATGFAASLDQPLFIAHGKNNRLHPPPLAEELRRSVPGAEFHSIDGKHNDFMTLDDPEFARLAAAVAAWFRAHL